MSDLDIVVRLDPQQPVAGAKAVTAELAKTETQAKKTEDAATGIAKLNFKQAAAGAAQAFELLNQKLKITDSAIGNVVGSSVKFAAMGAQMAGPYGAAAGAIVGASLEMQGAFTEFLETAERMEEGVKTVDERIAELTKNSSTLGRQFLALATGARTMGEAFELITTHLQRLHDAQATFTAMGPALAQVNAQLEAQKRILGEIDGPIAKFALDTTAVHMLWKTGAIDATEYTHRVAGITAALASADPAMAAMTAQHNAGAAAAKEHADELKRYAELVRKANTPIYDGEIPDAISGGRAPADPLTAQWKTSDLDVGAQKPFEMQDVKGASGDLSDIEKAFDAERVKQWKEEVEASQKSIDEIVQHMKPIEDFFVTAATTGKFEWRSMIDSMIADLARLAAQKAAFALAGALFGGGGGGFVGGTASGAGDGLMGTGYAAGGTIWPSGGGTADTQHIQFRKRPDETVHINTPAQERAYQNGGSGGGGSTVVLEDRRDPRALMQGGADTTRMVIEAVRSNPNAFRALLR